MAKISVRNVQKSAVDQYFNMYLSSAAARGVNGKPLRPYKPYFHDQNAL